ncbi:MAG: hypothetical protein KAR11_00295 [Phycisphaerae bacterium]|nr:hypothetical protein [Phycisphaerae bacterium]
MAEISPIISGFVSDDDVLAEIAAKHVRKLAMIIDNADAGSSHESKLPGDNLGKEMLSQQMVEKSEIDDIITG